MKNVVSARTNISISFLVGFALAVSGANLLVEGYWIAAYVFMVLIGAGYAWDAWMYERQNAALNQAIADLGHAAGVLDAHIKRMEAHMEAESHGR